MIAQWLAHLPLDLAATSSITSFSDFFQRKTNVQIEEFNQQRCSEKSGQWLENVHQTHLVVAELVLHKLFVLFATPTLKSIDFACLSLL